MNLSAVNLNLLLALDVLLDERSVSRAAARLGVTQPAMSHSLARLRRLFDDPLLARSGAELVPTAFAEGLRPALRAGLADLRTVVEARHEFDPAVSTRVFRIAASGVFHTSGVPALMGRLARVAPGVRFTVRPLEGHDARDLASARLDVGVGSLMHLPHPGLHHMRLGYDRFVVLIRADHPCREETLSLAEFCDTPHVVVASDEEPTFVDDALRAHGKTRKVALRVPDFPCVPHLVATLPFIAVVPRALAEAASATCPVRYVEAPVELLVLPIVAWWHERCDREPGNVWLRGELARMGRELFPPRVASDSTGSP